MRSHARRLVGATTVAAQVSLAVPAAIAQEGVTPETVVLGMEAPGKDFSLDEENLGFRLSFQERNDRGPLHGRKIVWKEYARTSGAAAAEAAANAQKLIESDRVFALINFGGPAAIAVAKLAKESKVPHLFPHTALVSSEGNRYLFTSFPRYEGEAAAMFKYLAQQRGMKRLAIVHDDNVYGQLFLRLLNEHAAASGYTVTGSAGVGTRNPADLSSELRTLAETKPDAIVMALYPAQAKALMAAKAALNWTAGRMVSVGPLTDEQYLNTSGGAAEGTLGFCYYPDPELSQEPGVAAYRAALARYHPGQPPNRYSLYGYVFGKLVAEGLERAGSDLTRERFVDAMETITDWDAGGIMPNVTFSASNHHAQRAGFICELKQSRFLALSGWVEP